jgi:DNA primase
MMQNRIVAPLHGPKGEIYGYLGRWVGPDETIPKKEGKYKLPRLRKLDLLYGLFELRRTWPTVKHVVVVEGSFSVYRLYELEVPSVALLGHELSQRHLDLLTEAGVRRLTFLLDGDDAGRESVPAMMKLLASSPLRAKFAVLPEDSQPDTVEYSVLAELLGLE